MVKLQIIKNAMDSNEVYSASTQSYKNSRTGFLVKARDSVILRDALGKESNEVVFSISGNIKVIAPVGSKDVIRFLAAQRLGEILGRALPWATGLRLSNLI